MGRVNIHIDTDSELLEKSTKLWEKRPLGNSKIDNKNRADITVGPVIKNYGTEPVTTSCWWIKVGVNSRP